MADGQFPTLVSKDQDPNSATDPIFTQLSDGAVASTFTGTSLNVNITGGATSGTQYPDDTPHVSGDLGTGALVVRQDTPASLVTSDGDYTHLSVDANGKLYAILTDSVVVTATNLDIRDLVFATDKVDVTGSAVNVNNGAGAAAVNIQDGGNSITVDGTVAVSSVAGNVTVVQPTGTNLHVVVDSGTIVVTATDLDIRDLNLTQDAVKVSGNTTANSLTNPIFVQNVNAIITGEVNSYNTATVTAGSTSNHDYTVVTAMKLKSVEFACSGAMKVEIQVGPVASLVTKAVGFIPNAGGNNVITFDPPIEVPTTSTGTVRVIRTNRNNQSTDVYSTILGIDA